MTNKELNCLSEGYILGRKKGGNLRPLKVTENGIYYPVDYGCNGFNQVDVNILNKATQIDNLPTWGEIIIDDDWSIKIKKSDEIEHNESYEFSKDDSSSPYLSRYIKYWRTYFCVCYKGQILFGSTAASYTSQYWEWSMYDSDKPWIYAYGGFKFHNITNISANKSYPQYGLSGLYIDIKYEVEEFGHQYDTKDDEVGRESHYDYFEGNTSITIGKGAGEQKFDFYSKDDYQKIAEDIIAYGQAVANSKEFEYKVYDV